MLRCGRNEEYTWKNSFVGTWLDILLLKTISNVFLIAACKQHSGPHAALSKIKQGVIFILLWWHLLGNLHTLQWTHACSQSWISTRIMQLIIQSLCMTSIFYHTTYCSNIKLINLLHHFSKAHSYIQPLTVKISLMVVWWSLFHDYSHFPRT